MRGSETKLQMVMRHVREGEVTLFRQVALIARLKGLGLDTDIAEDVLYVVQISQDNHIEHLERLQIKTDLLPNSASP